MEWNDETIARLRGFWEEGHSTAEIGRRLGVSKNAVVGKAHRLGLAARPSPIRREPSGRPRPPVARRVVGPTLPPLPAASAAPVPELPQPVATPRPVAPMPAAPRVVPTARVGGRLQACCWPLGEPGTRSFRFCDAELLAGKPYLRRTRATGLCARPRPARGSRLNGGTRA